MRRNDWNACKNFLMGYEGLWKWGFWRDWERKGKVVGYKSGRKMAKKWTSKKCAEQLWEENKCVVGTGWHNIQGGNWMCGSFMDGFTNDLFLTISNIWGIYTYIYLDPLAKQSCVICFKLILNSETLVAYSTGRWKLFGRRVLNLYCVCLQSIQSTWIQSWSELPDTPLWPQALLPPGQSLHQPAMSQGRSCSLLLCPSCSLWLLLSALGCCSQQLLWQQQRAGSAEGRGDRLWWWRCWLWELVWVVDKSGTHGPCYGSGHANILFAGWWWCPSWKNSDATYTCCWGVWRLDFTLGGLVLHLDGW